MKRRLILTSALVGMTLWAVSPPAAPAATSGLAWDSVTKFAMNADPSSLQPGAFDDDYATASSVQAPDQSSGGGLFGQIKQAMAMGQNVQAMMQNGLAEKHYVAGSKERTDEVAMQTATITDCVARTITTLNLKNKTYRVVSMDQPSAPSSGGGGNGSSGSHKDDGTKVAIVVTNSALGSRQVGGRQTDGFRSDMSMTETKPSGESHTQKGSLIGYYASIGMPYPRCPRAGSLTGGSMAPGQAFAMMAQATKLMRAMASAGLDKRFSITQSGPTMPAGHLSMYQAITFAAESSRGMTIVVERGDVRSIDENDPIFSVPAGFTKEQ
jgi:hypothetical protein